MGGLGYRSMFQQWRAGSDALRREHFDLVFFSTTMFPVMWLGSRWRQRFGVPYVLDFQDPWLSDYYKRHPGRRPPGGKFKYGFSQWIARRLEPVTVRGASHIVCVSKAYRQMFQRRYPEMPNERFTILPFGAPESDMAALSQLEVRQSLFDPNDGRIHWVYVGRGGNDMGFSVRALFMALAQFLQQRPELRDRLRLHFAGTDYATKDRARLTIEPLAQECGVGDVVSERPERLPYFETLRCLHDADALVIPGSDDSGYTASKLYPYILAKKPLIAIFHESSSVVEVLRRTGAGKVVTFGGDRSMKEVADEILRQFFSPWPPPTPVTDWNAFAPYTARSMTLQLCAMFDRVIAPGKN